MSPKRRCFSSAPAASAAAKRASNSRCWPTSSSIATMVTPESQDTHLFTYSARRAVPRIPGRPRWKDCKEPCKTFSRSACLNAHYCGCRALRIVRSAADSGACGRRCPIRGALLANHLGKAVSGSERSTSWPTEISKTPIRSSAMSKNLISNGRDNKTSGNRIRRIPASKVRTRANARPYMDRTSNINASKTLLRKIRRVRASIDPTADASSATRLEDSSNPPGRSCPAAPLGCLDKSSAPREHSKSIALTPSPAPEKAKQISREGRGNGQAHSFPRPRHGRHAARVVTGYSATHPRPLRSVCAAQSAVSLRQQLPVLRDQLQRQVRRSPPRLVGECAGGAEAARAARPRRRRDRSARELRRGDRQGQVPHHPRAGRAALPIYPADRRANPYLGPTSNPAGPHRAGGERNDQLVRHRPLARHRRRARHATCDVQRRNLAAQRHATARRRDDRQREPHPANRRRRLLLRRQPLRRFHQRHLRLFLERAPSLGPHPRAARISASGGLARRRDPPRQPVSRSARHPHRAEERARLRALPQEPRDSHPAVPRSHLERHHRRGHRRERDRRLRGRHAERAIRVADRQGQPALAQGAGELARSHSVLPRLPGAGPERHMRGPVMHAVIFWLALLLLPLSVQAQDFDCAALDAPPIASTVAPRDRLNALEQNGCLGGSNDRDALTHEIVNALPDGRAPRSPGVRDDERRAATLSALDRIAAAIERQFVELPTEAPPTAAERLHRLQQALLIARDEVAAASEHEGLHRPLYWKFDRNSGGFHAAAGA